jgi:hypothetical protein
MHLTMQVGNAGSFVNCSPRHFLLCIFTPFDPLIPVGACLGPRDITERTLIGPEMPVKV